MKLIAGNNSKIAEMGQSLASSQSLSARFKVEQ